MTVTYQHLSGTYENTDKVIFYNLKQSWNKTNTLNHIPGFENGTDQPDHNAQFENKAPNMVMVNTLERNYDENSDEVNSDTVHSIREEIVITIVAESRKMRILMEDEINRILWEQNINSVNRLNKSDGSSSHIDHYEKSEVSFRQIDLTDNNSVHLQSSEGILTVIYYKFRS